MNEQERINCPECDTLDGVGRRDFLMAVGGTAVTLAGLEALPTIARAEDQPAAKPAERTARPAEALIKELYQGLSDEQKRRVVYDWNHGGGNNQTPTRKRMYNNPIFTQHTIGGVYTPAQQDLNQRIFRAIASDEQGYSKLTRNGTFDASQSFGRCGAYIFGDPSGDGQFAWVFAGHHITVRCDGNSEPDTAFGGPMYYGHTPDPYSVRNCFNYQTRAVMSVWDALNGAQREQATIAMYPNPRELEGSIRFRREGYPGIAYRDLARDQRGLVRTVMRELLSPYRREDADEVMELVGRNGGMERIHLGFFRDAADPADKWTFWRLEGPGFVWNFRVLPHVHTYVNIALQPAQPAART
jgi:hypothetical protein